MEDRLKKFAAVVEFGSFTAAAAQLHISQPALTTAIQKLERELKTELLLRQGRTFSITETGKAAYAAAQELTTQNQNLRQRIRELTNEKITFNLGMIDGMAELLFVRQSTLPGLEQRLHLSLTVDNSARLVRYVEQGKLDLALVAWQAALPATLTMQNAGDEPLVLVTKPTHRDELLANLQHGMLPHFLSYNQQSQTYRLVADQLDSLGIAPYPTFYSTSPEIMLQILLSTKAVAVLPYLLVRTHLQRGNLTTLPLGGAQQIPRQIAAVRRSSRIVPPQITALLEQMQHQLKKLSAEAY